LHENQLTHLSQLYIKYDKIQREYKKLIPS